jgi:hypothetical protein
VVLPGLESVRHAKLDRLCEAIGDCRQTMNEAKTEERGLEQAAQQFMEGASPSLSVYKWAGVELALVPGANRLRVRLTKDTGAAETSGGTSSGDEVAEDVA